MRLRYKARALRHLGQIHGYIEKHNPAAAKAVIARMETSIARLERLPFSGRPGVVSGTRLLTIPDLPYVVVYRVGKDAVDVVAVLHTAGRRRS